MDFFRTQAQHWNTTNTNTIASTNAHVFVYYANLFCSKLCSVHFFRTQAQNWNTNKTSFLFHFIHSTHADSLFVLFGTEASIGVGHFDGQLLSALNDTLALATGHAVSDLSGEAAVLHQEHFQLLKHTTQAMVKSKTKRGCNKTGSVVANPINNLPKTKANIIHLKTPKTFQSA